MYILFLFFGFISPFYFDSFSPPLLLGCGWGAAPCPPLPNHPPPTPQHLLYLNLEYRKGALCFALTYYVYSVVNMQRRSVSCFLHPPTPSPPLLAPSLPPSHLRRPAEGAQPPRWPPGGVQPSLCSAVVPRHCLDGRKKTRQAPFFCVWE